ncbi:UNVERIFIED_CONTAM: hypothetical protein Sindi_0472100 [Sesamum indicum]
MVNLTVMGRTPTNLLPSVRIIGERMNWEARFGPLRPLFVFPIERSPLVRVFRRARRNSAIFENQVDLRYEILPKPILAIAEPKEITCATSTVAVGLLPTDMVTAVDMEKTRKAAPPVQILDGQQFLSASIVVSVTAVMEASVLGMSQPSGKLSALEKEIEHVTLVILPATNSAVISTAASQS